MAPEIAQLWLQGQTNPMPRKNRKYNRRPYWLTQIHGRRGNKIQKSPPVSRDMYERTDSEQKKEKLKQRLGCS